MKGKKDKIWLLIALMSEVGGLLGTGSEELEVIFDKLSKADLEVLIKTQKYINTNFKVKNIPA